MGFIRHQQENLAIRLLKWQYKKNNVPAPDLPDLRKQAGKIVDDAHRIARESGANILAIIKDLVEDLKNKG